MKSDIKKKRIVRLLILEGVAPYVGLVDRLAKEDVDLERLLFRIRLIKKKRGF